MPGQDLSHSALPAPLQPLGGERHRTPVARRGHVARPRE